MVTKLLDYLTILFFFCMYINEAYYIILFWIDADKNVEIDDSINESNMIDNSNQYTIGNINNNDDDDLKTKDNSSLQRMTSFKSNSQIMR